MPWLQTLHKSFEMSNWVNSSEIYDARSNILWNKILKIINRAPIPSKMRRFRKLYVNLHHILDRQVFFEIPNIFFIIVRRNITNSIFLFEDKVYFYVPLFILFSVMTSDFWIGGFYDITAEGWRWETGNVMALGTPFWTMT